jgi:signal transduction histidine kinase
MEYLSRFQERLRKDKVGSAGCIILASALVTYLVLLAPPELFFDSFYAMPIWIGLLAFGYWGGLVIATTSMFCFYLANFYFKGVGLVEALPATILAYLLFVAFSYGAYKFMLNQRKLNEAQADLQSRLAVQDQLHRQSQLLNQQNVRMAVVDERNRIAREIHDVLAQGFTAIVLQAEIAFLHEDTPAPVREQLEKIYQLARFHLQEARRSVADLRPLPLEGKTLQEAVQARVQLTEAEYQTQAIFESSGEVRPLPSEVETGLYRIAQEALNNAGQHSGASLIKVSLDYDEDEVCLTVQDNGRGFEQKSGEPQKGSPPSFGLNTMQERADMMGGWVSIKSTPQAGCRVRVSVPYPPRSLPPPVTPPDLEGFTTGTTPHKTSEMTTEKDG